MAVRGDNRTAAGDVFNNKGVHGFEAGVDGRVEYALANSRWAVGVGGRYWGNRGDVVRLNGIDQIWSIANQKVASDVLDVQSEFKRGILDVDADYRLIDNGEFGLSLINGVRAGFLSSDMVLKEIVGGVEEVNSSVHYYGFGPKVGIKSEFEFGHGFGFDSNLVAAALVGRDKTVTLHDTGTFLDVQRHESLRVVPVFDLELAGRYLNTAGPLTMSARAGIQAEYWLNGPDHLRSDDDADGSHTSTQDYFMFGPFVRLGVNW